MRILVTFAVAAEFGPWSSRHPFVVYEFENWERPREFDLLKANIGGNEVSVLLTGMGNANAQAAMRSVPVESYDACISSGLAGALEGSLQRREVVVARGVKTFDGKLGFKSDEMLTECAIACGARPVGASLTTERIIATADEKEKLSSAADIVEMESGYVLAAAAEYRLPAIAVRAVSDTSDEDLPVDFAQILDSRGQLKFGSLVKELGLHPYRIAPLARFGMQSRAAAKALADFLDCFIPAIARRHGTARNANFLEVSAT